MKDTDYVMVRAELETRQAPFVRMRTKQLMELLGPASWLSAKDKYAVQCLVDQRTVRPVVAPMQESRHPFAAKGN